MIVDELNKFPTNLSKVRNLKESDFIKKIVYEKLFSKFNAIVNCQSTSWLVTKVQYDFDNMVLKKKLRC